MTLGRRKDQPGRIFVQDVSPNIEVDLRNMIENAARFTQEDPNFERLAQLYSSLYRLTAVLEHADP